MHKVVFDIQCQWLAVLLYLLICGAAFLFILCHVLNFTLLLLHSCAFIFIYGFLNSTTLLFVSSLALLFLHSVALLLIHSGTLIVVNSSALVFIGCLISSFTFLK